MTGYSLRWKAPDLWSGGAYGPEGGILSTAVLVALILAIWKMPIAREERPLHVTSVPDSSSEA
jgi:hypothetical protein